MTEQPVPAATVISSIAALITSFAWPIVVTWFALSHKRSISRLLEIFGRKLASASKVKLGQVELENEIKQAIAQASGSVDDQALTKEVPETQVKLAEGLERKIKSSRVPSVAVSDALRKEIYALARTYERTRAKLPSGPQRTRKMNEIAAGMRTFAGAGPRLRNELTRSTSVGKRLAAICMLQVQPRPRYLNWLLQRLKVETQPFVFYQTAVALLEAVKGGFYINRDEVRRGIREALTAISSFKGGEPDQNTIDALEEALEMLQGSRMSS